MFFSLRFTEIPAILLKKTRFRIYNINNFQNVLCFAEESQAVRVAVDSRKLPSPGAGINDANRPPVPRCVISLFWENFEKQFEVISRLLLDSPQSVDRIVRLFNVSRFRKFRTACNEIVYLIQRGKRPYPLFVSQ